jgi:hypothetical protein
MDAMKIFISHIHEEAAIARAVKQQLVKCFASMVEVFLAEDVPHGEDWFAATRTELGAADLILALFSPASQHRPWVNIEAGFGIMSGKRVVPLCCLGLSPEDLPVIYGRQQTLEIDDPTGVEKLLNDIAKKTTAGKLLKPRKESVSRWISAVRDAAAKLRPYTPAPDEPPFVWVIGSSAGLSQETARLTHKAMDILAPEFVENGFRIAIGRSRLLCYLADRVSADAIQADQTEGHRAPFFERLSLEVVRTRRSAGVPNPVVILGRLGWPRGVRDTFVDSVGRVPDVALVIGGAPGGSAMDEARLASAAGIPVLSLSFTGGAAAAIESSFDPSLEASIRAVQGTLRLDELGPAVCDLIRKQVVMARAATSG